MVGALTFLLTGCLLQGALCRNWNVNVPSTIEVMRGSCVTIPCSFDILSKHDQGLDNTCEALWKDSTDNKFVFNSSEKNQIKGELMGILREKNCTTNLNVVSERSSSYYFRLDCKNSLKYTFRNKLTILIKDAPPPPTLTPSTLKVKEGTSVNLTCSAPAPCLPHPPTLSWTPKLGDSQETLQENEDKTKVQISFLTFTASHLHHGQKISCTAVYKRNNGSTYTTPEQSFTADVSYSPQNTTASVSPSGPVPDNNNVTLTCSSDANPPVKNYSWYRADGDQETLIGTGYVLNIQASEVRQPFFCKVENDLGFENSSKHHIDVQFPPQILPSSTCTKMSGQVNCSCETVGNPSPTLQWYLNRLPVNQSSKLTVITESLTDTSLRSIISVNQPQERDLSTLSCHSFNSLGSASRQFCVHNLQISAERQEKILLPVFITTGVAVFVIVCILLFALRIQRNQYESRLTGEVNTAASGQHLREGNEVLNKSEGICVTTSMLRQVDVALSETVTELNSSSLQNSGPDNAEGASESSGKTGGQNVIYSSVIWKTKSRKKNRKDSGLYLEEENDEAGGVCRNFLRGALETECLYSEVKPRNIGRREEKEFAQVHFEN